MECPEGTVGRFGCISGDTGHVFRFYGEAGDNCIGSGGHCDGGVTAKVTRRNEVSERYAGVSGAMASLLYGWVNS